MAAAVFLMARWIFGMASPGYQAASAQAVASSEPDASQGGNLMDPRLRLTELEISEDKFYAGNGRNIFRDVGTERVRRVSSRAPLGSRQPVSFQPAIRQFPLTFFGIAKVLDLPRKACLSEDGEVFIGGEGDIVDRRYRIQRIGSSSVDVEDLLENTKHTLTLQQ